MLKNNEKFSVDKHKKADFHTICYNYSENAGSLPNLVILMIPNLLNILVMLIMLKI